VGQVLDEPARAQVSRTQPASSVRDCIAAAIEAHRGPTEVTGVLMDQQPGDVPGDDTDAPELGLLEAATQIPTACAAAATAATPV
jgi:hypothetical protein